MASDLPIDVQEQIFLRLDDAANLVRASAACTSFRRAISDDHFLRRLRSVHRRPVLGLLLDNQHCKTGLFCPAQPPRRSAQAAAGFANAADFTFSFLPGHNRWRVCDARDGRVLLTEGPRRHYILELDDLAVYDPLHRRHIQIPAIPRDLVLAAKQQDDNNEGMAFDDPFFAPAIDDEDESSSSSLRGFQVMCTGLSNTKVMAFIFSSASGQWRCVASFSNQSYKWTNLPWLWFRQCVHGCVFWAHEAANAMLVFDMREMKFSIADLPNRSIGKFKMAVEAGDGGLGALVLSNRCTTIEVYSKAWQDIQEPEEWRHDSSIPMPGFHLKLAGSAEGYALLRGIPQDQHKKKKPEAHYFTLELKTLLVERLCVTEFDTRPKFLYASFPPPISPPPSV